MRGCADSSADVLAVSRSRWVCWWRELVSRHTAMKNPRDWGEMAWSRRENDVLVKPMKECPYCGFDPNDGVAIQTGSGRPTAHAEAVRRVECPNCERPIDAIVAPTTGSASVR